MLPVFPLRGAILLPRATLALNVFEPRYLVLVDYALAGDRLIGIVQPAPEAGDDESPTGKSFPLRRVGCVGRITAFTESDDGRLMHLAHRHHALPALARRRARTSRFAFARSTSVQYATRLQVRGTARRTSTGRACSQRSGAISTANNLSADWDRIDNASNERLVNTLSILSPYGPEEKQAPARGQGLRARAEALVALAEMELAARDDGSGTSLQ